MFSRKPHLWLLCAAFRSTFIYLVITLCRKKRWFVTLCKKNPIVCIPWLFHKLISWPVYSFNLRCLLDLIFLFKQGDLSDVHHFSWQQHMNIDLSHSFNNYEYFVCWNFHAIRSTYQIDWKRSNAAECTYGLDNHLIQHFSTATCCVKTCLSVDLLSLHLREAGGSNARSNRVSSEPHVHVLLFPSL